MGKKIDQSIKDAEAATLAKLFAEKNIGNYAEFARKHGVPGGKSMVKQHLDGMRPISIDAGIAYAAGLGCSLNEISARLSAVAEESSKFTTGRQSDNNFLSSDEKKIIAAYRATDARGKAALAWMAEQCLRQNQASLAEQVAAIDPDTLATSEEVRDKANAGRTV